ncbi:SIMPL domain-containing protein [Kineococcus glutinatus]|uniref:DUF541 domain-containing protein n=1 Tax=Kineococcus glutinatus TaxID=1070872 RepID=A0ABP9I589_9ACTN
MAGTAPLVTVRGEAAVPADPELARFSASLHVPDADRRAALARMAALHEQARAALAGTGGGARVESGPVSVYLEHHDPASPVPTRYVATAELTVEVVDLTLLPAVVDALSGVEVGFSGPSWELRPGSPAHARARAAALRDALRRAAECAAVLGCELVELVEVDDEERGGGFGARGARMSARGEADVALSLDLTPVGLTVRAGVRARFRTTAPDLPALLAALPPTPEG